MYRYIKPIFCNTLVNPALTVKFLYVYIVVCQDALTLAQPREGERPHNEGTKGGDPQIRFSHQLNP